MNYIEILGGIGLLAGAVGLWTAVRKRFEDRNLFNLSTLWVLSYLAPGFLLWTAYNGVERKDRRLLVLLAIVLTIQMSFTFSIAVARQLRLKKVFANIRARGTHDVSYYAISPKLNQK
jgi:hypothetical protein